MFEPFTFYFFLGTLVTQTGKLSVILCYLSNCMFLSTKKRYNTYQEPKSGLSVLVYSRNIVVQHGGFCSKDILQLDTALEPEPRSVLWKLLSGVEAKKFDFPAPKIAKSSMLCSP